MKEHVMVSIIAEVAILYRALLFTLPASQISMSVVMEFTFVSKSATTPMVLTTASATKAIGSTMMAMHAKVSTKPFMCTVYTGDDSYRC